MSNGLLKVGIADGQHRKLFQVPDEEKEPQTAGGKRRTNVPYVRQSPGRKFRASHPEKVDQAHKNQPNGHGRQDFGIALKVARKQQKERDKKVEDDHDDGHHAPLAVQARIVESDFLRQIAGPNDKKLGEIEIGPEHQESEQQFAQVVSVAGVEKVLDRGLGPAEKNYVNT